VIWAPISLLVSFLVSPLVAFTLPQSSFAIEPSKDDAKQTQDYINSRNYKSLIELQSKILSSQKKANAKPTELISTLLTLGNAHFGLGNFAEAKSAFEQGAKLAAQTKDKEQIANFERQLGMLALRQSKYKESLNHLLTAKHLDERKGKDPDKNTARDNYCLGRFLEKEKKWLAARDEYNSSITGFEFGYGKNCSETMVPIWCLYMCAKGRGESVEDKLCWAKLQQLRQVHKDFLMFPVEEERQFFDLWYRVPVAKAAGK